MFRAGDSAPVEVVGIETNIPRSEVQYRTEEATEAELAERYNGDYGADS